jgi:hypothetical protein
MIEPEEPVMAEQRPSQLDYESPQARQPWFIMHWGGWVLLIVIVILFLLSMIP